MATTNQERQATFRAKKAEKIEEIGLELAKTTAENREMREKIAALELKLTNQTALHAKKVSNLEKRLLKALERK
ncbi:hypothetical protein [Actimicrobium sp. CCI2.3]|uniref:hypothetical protein n=1 Tax=Actimicrobium sp. CCI2.3 TaxID=3048616 RepID=UPI002B241672|nr:hypothetical protein [Actimicrobium sp. CCI2.3]MEB0023814.1 hypothetical protein [Actimicrobium sp. CCI2.3]